MDSSTIPLIDIDISHDIIVIITQRRFQYRNASDNYNLALLQCQLLKLRN